MRRLAHIPKIYIFTVFLMLLSGCQPGSPEVVISSTPNNTVLPAFRVLMANPQDVERGQNTTINLVIDDGAGNIQTQIIGDTIDLMGLPTSPITMTFVNGQATALVSSLTAGIFNLSLANPTGLVAPLDISSVQDVEFLPLTGTKLVFSGQPSLINNVGVAFATQPIVEMQNDNNELVTEFNSTISFTLHRDSFCSSTTITSEPLIYTPGTDQALAGVISVAAMRHNIAGNYHVKASALGVASACSDGIQINSGVADRLSFVRQPLTPAISSSDFVSYLDGVQFEIEVLDTFGNRDISATNLITINAYSDSSCLIPAVGVLNPAVFDSTAVLGTATFTTGNYSLAETIFLGGSAVGLTSVCSNGLTIIPDTIDSLNLIVQPAATGTPDSPLSIQPVLDFRDAQNNLVGTNIAVAVETYTDSSCLVPATGITTVDVSSLNAVGGIVSIQGLTYSIAETVHFKFSAAGLETNCSSAVNISHGVQDQLVMTIIPGFGPTDAGVDFLIQPEVRIRDAHGNQTIDTDLISFEAFKDSNCLIPGTGVLNNNSTNAIAGVANFSGLNYTETGFIYLKANNSSLSTTCEGPLLIEDNGATRLVFEADFSTLPIETYAAGEIFRVEPTIRIQDDFNNNVTSATDTVTLNAFLDSSCTIPTAGTLTVGSGPQPAVFGLVTTFDNLSHDTQEDIYLQASAPGLISACSNVVNIRAPEAAGLVFSTNPTAVVTAGDPITTAISFIDHFGAVFTPATESITLTPFNTPDCSGPPATGLLDVDIASLQAVAGVVNPTGLNYTLASEIYLKAESFGVESACSTKVTVVAGSANGLAFTTQPSPAVSPNIDLPVQPVVQIVDGSGNPVLGVNDSILLEPFSDQTCSTPITSPTDFVVDTNPLPTVSGAANYTGMRFLTNQNYFLRASATIDGSLLSTCSEGIIVNNSSPSSISFSIQPSSSATAGQDLTIQPQLAIFDSAGSLHLGFNSSVTLTAYSTPGCQSPPLGVVEPGIINVDNTSLTASGGIVDISGLNITRSGTFYLQAEFPGLASACSNAVVVNEGAPGSIAFIQQPQANASINTLFSSQPHVAIQDNFGNNISSINLPITLELHSGASSCDSISAAALTLDSNPLMTVNGIAQFTGLLLNQPGSYRLRAIYQTFSACSDVFVVNSSTATSLSFINPVGSAVGAIPSVVSVNDIMVPSPLVQLEDSFGNVIVSETSTISLTAHTDSSCSSVPTGNLFVNASSLQASAGIVVTSGVSHGSMGNIYLRASLGGIANDCTGPINVIASLGSDTVEVNNLPTTGIAGQTLSSFTVTVRDNLGNIITSPTRQISLASFSDSSCSIPSSSALQGDIFNVQTVNGVATFSNVSHLRAENLFVLASSSSGGSTCSGPVDISPAIKSRLVVSLNPSTEVEVGEDFSIKPTVQVQDDFGNVVTSATDTITVDPIAFTDSSCLVASTSGGLVSFLPNPPLTIGGEASWTNMSYNQVESIYLRFSAPGLAPACSSLVNIIQGPYCNSTRLAAAPFANSAEEFTPGVFFDGTTRQLAYTICTEQQFNNIGNLNPVSGVSYSQRQDRFYRLESDLDLSSLGFYNVIGRSPLATESFTGSFNGNGYEISNLTISGSTSNHQGLFGYVDGNSSIEKGVIENIKLTNPQISTSGNTVGSIVAALFNGQLKRSSVVGGTLDAAGVLGASVGALVNSTVLESYVHRTKLIPTGGLGVGGFAGRIENSRMTDIYSTALISSPDSTGKKGGLIGANINSIITRAYFAGYIPDDLNTRVISGDGGAFTEVFAPISALGAEFTELSSGTELVEEYELRLAKTFSDWNLGGTWRINDSVNNGMPTLSQVEHRELENLCLAPLTTYNQIGTGVGEDPFIICDLDQLIDLKFNGASDYDKHFRLESDISLAPHQNLIIGNQSNPFTGVFDGNSYSLASLNILRTSSIGTITNGLGLFGYLNGQLKNITLVNPLITVSEPVTNVGSIVGLMDSNASVDNVSILNAGMNITGQVTGLGGAIGQVASGSSYVTLLDFSGSIDATAMGTSQVGGLIGEFSPAVRLNDGNLVLSRSSGFLNSYSEVGGLIGKMSGNPLVIYGQSTMMINTTGARVGGLVGLQEGGLIQFSFSSGNIDSTNAIVGGLVGQMNSAGIQVEDSYSSGNVTGSINVGGIVGATTGIGVQSVVRSYASGFIKDNALDSVGGIFGLSSSTTTLVDSFWNINPLDEELFPHGQPEVSFGEGSSPAGSGGFLGSTTGSGGFDGTSSFNAVNMTTRTAYQTTAGLTQAWSFVGDDSLGIWNIDPLVNNGFPYLRQNSPLGINTDFSFETYIGSSTETRIFYSSSSEFNSINSSTPGYGSVNPVADIDVKGNNIYIAKANSGEVSYSANKGHIWTSFNTGCGLQTAISGSNDLILVACPGLGVACSSNNGASWSISSILGSTSINDVFIDGNNQYIATSNGLALRRSSDCNGAVEIFNNATAGFSASSDVRSVHVSGQTILAGTTAGLSYSLDNGSHWTSRIFGIDGFPAANIINSVFADGNNFVVTTSAGIDAVGISNDKGLTWNSISAGENGFANTSSAACSSIRGDRIYICADNDLYRTDITGSVWTLESSIDASAVFIQ